jgi:hypothetical protein
VDASPEPDSASDAGAADDEASRKREHDEVAEEVEEISDTKQARMDIDDEGPKNDDDDDDDFAELPSPSASPDAAAGDE